MKKSTQGECVWQQAGREANWQVPRFLIEAFMGEGKNASLCQCKFGELFQHYGLLSAKWSNQPWSDYNGPLEPGIFFLISQKVNSL